MSCTVSRRATHVSFGIRAVGSGVGAAAFGGEGCQFSDGGPAVVGVIAAATAAAAIGLGA